MRRLLSAALAAGTLLAQVPIGPPSGYGAGGASNLTTVGAVPYVCATGALCQDSGLTWDSVNKRLIIVTSGSTATLSGCTGSYVCSGVGGANGFIGSAMLTGLSSTDGAGFQGYGNGLVLGLTAFASWTNGTLSGGTIDTALRRNSAGVVEVNNGSGGTYRDIKRRFDVSTVATVASAATIAPADNITRVTGAVTISTITAPTAFAVSGAGGCLTLIPDTGATWVTNTAGNIALASTAVVGKQLIMCYDNATSKWYPSY